MIQYQNTTIGNFSSESFLKTVYYLNTFNNRPVVFVAPWGSESGNIIKIHSHVFLDNTPNIHAMVPLSRLISEINSPYFIIGADYGNTDIVIEKYATISWLAIGT